MYHLPVYKCSAPFHKNGRYTLESTSLVFEEGKPVAVLVWKDEPDGSLSPAVRVQLDPKWLHPLGSNPDDQQFSYEMPIEWPES